MSIDLLLKESLNGGELALKGADVATVSGIENMPYLLMFGGGEPEWWGNGMIPNPAQRFVSTTEITLNTVALNSAGRVAIEAAVKADLKPLTDAGIEVKVLALIRSDNRVEISINLDGKEISFIWNPDGTVTT